jgi:hypothetical protein
LGPTLFALTIHPKILKVKARVAELLPNEIDLATFYLDDGAIADSDRAVALFCTLLRDEFADIGLDLAFPKCEVIPAAGADHEVLRTLFPDFIWVESGGFKLLGAPFGGAEFCAAHTSKRKAKAETLLQDIGGLESSQAALLLIRHCASFCKLAYSARTVPPAAHAQALQEFNGDLRKALEDILGDEMSERNWMLAQLGIVHGGLGLRDASLHAPAAYVASVLGTRELCKSIDPRFDIEDTAGGLGLQAAQSQLRASVLPGASIGFTAKASQKSLSKLVDAAAKDSLLQREKG